MYRDIHTCKPSTSTLNFHVWEDLETEDRVKICGKGNPSSMISTFSIR